MSIQLVIVCVYIAMLFAISFWVKRRADKGSVEYLFAGHQLGYILVGVSVTGLAVGAASTVGVAEQAFSVGVAAGWYNGAWAIGAVFMGFIAAGKIRKWKVSTIPEFFERYYDTKGRIIAALGLVIVMCCIASLQYLAGGAILSALLPDIFVMRTGMFVSAIVFIGITLIGGLWSSGLSNLVSVILIYVGVIYSCIVSIGNAGGMEVIASKLSDPGKMLSPIGGLPMAVIIGWIMVMLNQCVTAQGMVQIACGAKDEKTARKGFILGGLLIFPVGFLCSILGIVALVQFPDITATMALPKVVMGLNPFASGVTLAAMWAADVSTACTILLAAGTLFSQDIYKRFINPKISDEKFVKINRMVIFIIGLVTLWFAFNAVGIVRTMTAGLSLTAPFTCVFLLTVFAPSICRKSSAFWATLAGLAGIVVWNYVQELHVLSHVIYFEMTISLATIFIVSIFDKRRIKAAAMEEGE
ncbi:MAG: sodium:solute symporter family protein [Phascolarctobacterium sp.]|nr:sodium:solute symporter family protein [Phascolarctobacterium sp.]